MDNGVFKKIILDLCGGTGNWSKPYANAGYDVRLVTLPTDIRLVEREDIYVQGILAAPPCTVFANSGARWERTREDMLEGLSIMDACLRAVVIYKPVWWALENPVGKMKKYLGPPTMTFNPCDYGEDYTKRTLLWGNFKQPLFNPAEATEGSKLAKKYGGKSAKTKEARSITPAKFAEAFFKENQ